MTSPPLILLLLEGRERVPSLVRDPDSELHWETDAVLAAQVSVRGRGGGRGGAASRPRPQPCSSALHLHLHLHLRLRTYTAP